MRSSLVEELGVFVRFAPRLRRFLATTLTPPQAERLIEEQLARREETFLAILERAVYGNRRSPYRFLLEAAGIELGDAVALVREAGLEGALARLHDAGVHVTLDEFKGRVPIERPGVSLPRSYRAFDNPLQTVHQHAATSGARGARRRVSLDLDLLEHESAYHSLFLTAFGLWERPYGVWRAIPPAASGIKNGLRQAKVGRRVDVWFSPIRARRDLDSLKFALFTQYTVRAGRLFGAHLEPPEYCPPSEAARVAQWLADRKREGRPAVLDTQASLGVRVCRAARSEGIDVAGTFFRFGGEPLTAEKQAVVEEAGCRAVCHYTMAETSRIAVACADPVARDDMHFLSDKLAVVQRDKAVGGVTVGAFHYTTLLTSAPKLMINVESDDYGVLEQRSCDCPLGRLGLTWHMHEIRSYEKLTSEGNQLLGSDLIGLVERVLPGRFGGDPADYQLVEEEVEGLTKVSLVVRPGLGPLDEREVVATVLEHLAAKPRNRLMADVWREGETLRVVRREPYLNAVGKILPLHIAQPRRRAGQRAL